MELTTPIYIKSQTDMPWPDDPVFYLMTSEGLFLCRNHRFFKSSVPARAFPRELSWHNSSLHLHYPRIPQGALEQVLAFFIHVGEHYSAEAIVLLAWDETWQRSRIIVPDQIATVGQNRWNETWPIAVEYQMPKQLPEGWVVYGDVHSHVDGSAGASHIDRDDEAFKAGLHIIFGRVFDPRPDFSAQAVVDGFRFNLKEHHVFEGYHRPARRFPRRWLERMQVERPGQKPKPIVPRVTVSAADESPKSESESASSSPPDGAAGSAQQSGESGSNPQEQSP
jgi:hypothetical protein